MNRILFFMVLAIVFSSCFKDRMEKDEQKILDYIEENNLDAQQGEDGLYFVIEEEGTGKRPDITSTVKVDYEGFLTDGAKFDSSIDRGTPATFPLLNVIEGWQIGIPLFKEGGKGMLLIPSHLGYGKTPPPGGTIGKNEVLVFTIDLIEVVD